MQNTKHKSNIKNKKFLVIFGPPAVGKFTVAEELSKITDFKVLHNHGDIDMLRPIFEFDSPAFKTLSKTIRKMIIEEAIKSDLSLVFTYVWNFSREGGKENMDLYKYIVEENGGTAYFVELFAELDVRIERSLGESRKKYTKIKDKEIIHKMHAGQQNNTDGNFFYPEFYLKIDNTHTPAAEVASIIKKHFDF